MTLKAIPHFARINSEEYRYKCAGNFDSYNNKRFVSSKVMDEKTGRVVSKSEFKNIDSYEELKMYKVSDFALENLTAVGADLRPTSIASSAFNVIDSIPQ